MAEGDAHNLETSRSVVLPPIKPKRAKSANTNFPHYRRFKYESPEKLKELEKSFVLDGITLSKQANDEVDRTQPSLNLGIPQYNALHDKHCKKYFKSKSLPKTVQEAKQVVSTGSSSELSASMMGQVFDKFIRNSSTKHYLQEREALGAGYTRKLYGGHLSIPTTPSVVGYHGDEGYRRNTFDLRKKRSAFDYEDPFDDPKPLNRRLRTQSAPATVRLMRLKSASIYRAPPGGRRAVSAIPRAAPQHRELATGPVA
ncbi:sperm microtubule associated protein 1-like [Halichondria panicea]|uniref:sperm microtubule associated protein 1-like n=1 Tax=Halichondria panicea TaxID=6063 RepID=UPI00312BB541